MSKQKKGFGRAGLSVLATSTLVIGAGAAFMAPANAAPALIGQAPGAPTLTATSTPPAPDVLQGASNQAAGNLKYEFTDSHGAGATVTFKIHSNSANPCDTSSDIASSSFFSSVPTVTESAPSGSLATADDNITTTTASSSTQCAALGLKDEVVVTFNNSRSPFSDGSVAGALDLNVTNIKYNVGAGATIPSSITVNATPSAGPNGFTLAGNAGTPTADVANATVANAPVQNFTVTPVQAAVPGADNVSLGTATIKGDSTDFAPNTTTGVTLTLSDTNGATGTLFTNGTTPNITVPSGFRVTKDAAGAIPGTSPTTASNTYTFYVYAPPGSNGGTITVSGLQVDTTSNSGTVDLDSSAPAGATAQQALNLVYQERIGGADRYGTAAKLFSSKFNRSGGACGSPFGGAGASCAAVLSGGTEFADALSANFLASDQNTGTLLTRTNSLPDVTRQALINDCVTKVYITGQTGAVSQAVADAVSSIPVCGATSALSNKIQVERLGGRDRYDTNRDVNLNSNNGPFNTVFMANGSAPFDSLSVGPLVYAEGAPLVLTAGQSMNHGEEAELTTLGAKNIVIVGGTGVVSQAIQDQLVKDGYTVARVGGADRYATAVQVAKLATTGIDNNGDGVINSSDGLYDNFAGDLSSPEINVTNGQYYADALSAGPIAGSESQVILLARDANTPGDAITGYVGGLTTNDINTIRSLGGIGVTSPALGNAIAAAIGD